MSANNSKKEAADFQWVEDSCVSFGKGVAAVGVTIILATTSVCQCIWRCFYPKPPEGADKVVE
jgi:hypothetical protein